MSLTREISEYLQKGRFREVEARVGQALDEHLAPRIILQEGLLPGMSEVGARFKTGEIFVPEVMMAARAFQKALDILGPHLAKSGTQPIGTVVLGTVQGDQHDIGKNLVKMMMMGAGLSVIDLGADVPAARFVGAVREHAPDIVGLSALLTTTMDRQGEVIEALRQADLRGKVRVMIGGAPVTQGFAERIGADAYTPDAATAAEVAKAFCTENGSV